MSHPDAAARPTPQLLSSPMLSLCTGSRIASSGMRSSGIILVMLTSTVAWRWDFSFLGLDRKNPLKMMEFISDDDIPYEKNKSHVPNHQPDRVFGKTVFKKKKRAKSHTVRGAFIATMKTTVLGDGFSCWV